MRTHMAGAGMPFTQRFRPLSIQTVLDEDVLLLQSLKGSERLGRPFEYTCELLSERADVSPSEVLAQPVTVRINPHEGTSRLISAYVSRFTRFPRVAGRRLTAYRATLVPWLWFLSRSNDCRIFQGKSVVEILELVLEGLGLPHAIDDRTTYRGSHRKREYCVQYLESHLDFVSRLMEEEGIYYFFEHEADKHTMVLCDGFASHGAEEGGLVLPYRERSPRWGMEECVWNVMQDEGVRATAFSATDFDFRVPRKHLNAGRAERAPNSPLRQQVFEFPGGYTQYREGDEHVSLVRLEELVSERCRFTGATSAAGLGAGSVLSMEPAPLDIDKKQRLLMTEVEFEARNTPFEHADDARREAHAPVYAANFVGVRSQEQFRPARTTRKPVMRGPQTAVVVGPRDQEIHPDEHGRVKVHFHWDRHDHSDENSSCFIRVSQAWAGTGFGTMFIPRVGQEVIVDFLEGDPDRPIITGRVYNGDNRPPYELPANQTQSGMKTRSSPGGSASDFNELRFEDKKGAEQVYIHAQKDKMVVVEDNNSESVGSNESISVGGNRSKTVAKDEQVQIDGNSTEVIGKAAVMDVGSTLVIKAGVSITLQCGASTIHMNQAGFITITGTVVTMAGAVNCNVAAPITNVVGGVLMTVSGAINLSSGLLNKMSGGMLASVNGSKVDVVASGDTIVKGSNVLLNC